MNRLPLRDITQAAPVSRPRNRLPRKVDGRYTRLRQVIGACLVAVFFTLPWWRWNGEQAVWLNLREGHFNLFGASFWPEDLNLLAGTLIVAAFALFFVTVIAGRVWCGYACPQTLWAAIFTWCERLTERGRRNGRHKAARRVAKHLLWLGVSGWTAVTLVALFVPLHTLLPALDGGNLGLPTLGWLVGITLATYGNAGWLREHLCVYLCPYARFQAVMFDTHTPVVSYDRDRNDCVECTLCVQVCPTGIDIRDGVQIACIACGACGDACDGVMARMNLAKGLVAYRGTVPSGRPKGPTLGPLRDPLRDPLRHPLRRSRVVGYGLALMASLAVLAQGVASRPLVSLTVSKDRLLYRDRGDGHIENLYSLTLMNKSQHTRDYQLRATGLTEFAWRGVAQLSLAPGEQRTAAISLALPYARASHQPVSFEVSEASSSALPEARAASVFTGVAR
ncbi:cytochrome c oxidase accessory protein CcoG [Pseudomonas japonica]|uniref:cytochrome c oxidase accessory protein CcoG n=1 Tax=Pseudomonas japonica TaxID=256466 RepID=UPI0015E2B43E|nr:cytochrome c oxidase accessory protein CcoG [Pseudomonas japonica]MBA1287333.1 cytochrome c oxidase accessory protein CcoG [Pseudomonas japonica]